MESSVLSKMRDVKRYITGEPNSYVPSGNTAELREDLDQAKTQMGMTESLLNALSPSDSLEIFTKLEVPPSVAHLLASDLLPHSFLFLKKPNQTNKKTTYILWY